jgi:arginine/lysine/ornithine decarboxylase
VDDDWDVAHGVAPDTLRHALSEHPEIKAVYLVSPDYYGVASDLKALAEICHQHGKPLVVDEAWGPHFPFHPRLPSHAIACGADLAMGSIHTTMNGLGASAVILLKGDRIDQTRFEKAFDLFETTSPPSILLGSIDAARRQMAQQGKSLWSRVFRLSDRVREQLARIEGLRVMGTEVIGTPGAHALDETKIVLDVKGLGVSGFAAGDWLWSEQRVAFELADHRRLMAILSVADDARSAGRLVKAVRALAKWAPRAPSKKRYVELPPERDLALQWVLPPGKAHLGPVRRVKLEKAEGEVAAEMVSPYPPGIPRIVPGTRITRPIVEYFKRGLPAGLFQMDAADEKLETLLVVDQ